MFFLFLPLCSNSARACLGATYQSIEGATLNISKDLVVKVHSEKSEKYLYSGIIKDYPVAEIEMYDVIPDDKNLGKNATIHLGGDCEYIKMYWWSGERFKSDFHKYLFRKNA